MNMEAIFAVINTTQSVVKVRPEKKIHNKCLLLRSLPYSKMVKMQVFMINFLRVLLISVLEAVT